MNIVQLQYKLRDMPESAVKAAANGQNPEIPEMLATMEMNRRERMEKAGAKPPTKSIKEQLEEKLSAPPQEQMGLPAMLQQAQQANGAPQQEQVQQPGQPPQQGMPPQQPGMPPQQMAQQPGMPPQQLNMGGIAGLPSDMFKHFDSGGIVAFAEGDLVDESAAETARLKAREEEARLRELEAMRTTPEAKSSLPPEVLEGMEMVKQSPFVSDFSRAVQDMREGVEVTSPEQKMEQRQGLYKQYGIRPPGDDDLARLSSSKQAYERDKQERAQYQALKALAAGARPNVYGRYMPGTIGESVSSFGLANLDADRTFREANETAEVAAKKANQALILGDLNTAIKATEDEKTAKREANKAGVTALGQMASSSASAVGTYMTNAESKRYHDMWERIQNKDLKLKAQQIAQTAQSNIPEMFRAIDQFSKRYPDMASKMSPENLLLLGAEMSKVNKGFDERAQTAYENQRIKVQEDRQKARSAPDVRLLEMDVDSLTKSGKDPQKLQKAKDALKVKYEKIEAAHPMPTPPRGGLETLLNPSPSTPAPTAAPGEPKTKYRMTKDGKLAETSP